MSDLERAESSRSPRHQWHAEKVQCRQAEKSRTTAKPSYFLRLNLFSFILLMSLGWESGGCVLGGGSVLPAGQQAEGASVFRPNTGTVFLSSVLGGVVGSEGLFHFLML